MGDGLPLPPLHLLLLRLLLLLHLLLLLPPCGALYWTAVVELEYARANATVRRACECGVYGRGAALAPAAGALTPPIGDAQGCDGAAYARNDTSARPWLALVKRGNCTFAEKIGNARRRGAAAVLVYNADGSGNATLQMAHDDVSAVAVMIGNALGAEMAALLGEGVHVHAALEVGAPRGPWADARWLYVLVVTFVIVTASAAGYFAAVAARRLWRAGAAARRERRRRRAAGAALARLPLRRAPEGGDDACAVCLEAYGSREPGVAVLPCAHLFHRACVVPWLMARGTCPVCKSDVMAALGVEGEEPEKGAVVTVTAEAGRSRYDNRGFQGDAA